MCIILLLYLNTFHFRLNLPRTNGVFGFCEFIGGSAGSSRHCRGEKENDFEKVKRIS